MHAQCLRISDLRYNPERSAFEALVSVYDAGLTYRYAAHVTASLYADFALISRGLAKRAITAHKSARPGLRMHLRPRVKHQALPFAA